MSIVRPFIPPFPSGLATADLIVLDFDLLSQGDEAEAKRFLAACKDEGFFYLKNHHVNTAAAFHFGKGLFDLPLQEKEGYAMGSGANYLGYKRVGDFIVDSQGTPDSQETWNVVVRPVGRSDEQFSKDDAFGFSSNPRYQHSYVTDNRQTICEHITSCRKITATLLDILSNQLNFISPALPSLHEFLRPAGNQMRIIKSSANTTNKETLVAGAHTDFGSLTVLFNNLGGLQVYLSAEQGWRWVPPVQGYAIINLGDALVQFTDGLLRSATHRVAQPPPQHRAYDRYSVVYFERPNDDVRMGPLGRGGLEGYQTAREWIERRVLGGKTIHYKGEKEYLAGRGTESSD
jgi:isopenicillin N synthase-like dioxygenase